MNFASDNTRRWRPRSWRPFRRPTRTASSYGADALTERLTALAREVFETDLAIFPVSTGTAANGLALSALSPPFGAIYCHETAHILLEEGAPSSTPAAPS